MKNDCLQSDNIEDYLENKLTEEAKASFEEHCQQCETCLIELNRQKQRTRQQEQTEELLQAVRANKQSQRAVDYISNYKQGIENDNLQVEKNQGTKQRETALAAEEEDPAKVAKKIIGQNLKQEIPSYLTASIIIILLVSVVLIAQKTFFPADKAVPALSLFEETRTQTVKQDIHRSEVIEKSFSYENIDDGGTFPLTDAINAATIAEEHQIKEVQENKTWESFNGKFSDLACVNESLFLKEEQAQQELSDFFVTAEGVRILVEKTSTAVAPGSNSTDQLKNESQQAGLVEKEKIYPDRCPSKISKLLMLSAWPQEELEGAAINLDLLLTNKNYPEYVIIKVDNNQIRDEIAELIGAVEADKWKQQIIDHELLDSDWAALLISFDEGD